MDTSNPIRDRRRALGLSRRELGALIDLRPSAVGQLERSDTSPTGETLTRLAGVFSVPAVSLEIELETFRQALHASASRKLEAVG